MMSLFCGIIMFISGLVIISSVEKDPLLSGLGALIAVMGGWMIGSGIVELIPT